MGTPRERAPRVPAAAQPLSAEREGSYGEAVARIVSVVSDLMLASRVSTQLAGAGHEVEQEASLPAELDGVDLVVADLDDVDPEALGEAGVPAIGFYQHTDTDIKKRADEAGIAMAVPRSRMARELPDLVAKALG